MSGEAYVLSADVVGFDVLERNPSVVLPAAGGTTEAHLLDTGIPFLVSTGTLDAESSGTIGVANATASSTARVEDLDLLDGLVTADVLQATTNCTGNGATATCTASTTFLNLRVGGILVVGVVAPNSFISVPGIATVFLNEQTAGGNGTTTASLTVNMVRVVLLGGLGNATVASAHSDVDFRPLSNTCACSTPDNTVSGEGFGTFIDLLNQDLDRNPHAILSENGGSAFGRAESTNIAALLDTGVVTSGTTGTVTPAGATSGTTSAVATLSILGTTISADAIQAQVTCAGNGTTAGCTAAGSSLANLRVLGIPIVLMPPPNTVIALPLIGSVTLNEQIASGNGTTTASLTVNMIHVHLAGILGSGDVIVASAQAGVDFTTVPVCPNPCDDGNACNGTEICHPVNGCQAGAPPVCNDGNACNGVETCAPATGCQPGTPLNCGDGNVCNGTETCSPMNGCQPGSPLVCDDGQVCNGVETCDPTNGCQPGIPQCPVDPGCLLRVEARIKDSSLIVGALGVNDPLIGRINLGRTVFMPDGSTLEGNRVQLGNGTNVWRVLVNDLRLGRDVTIRNGTGLPSLPIQDPFCPVSPITCGTTHIATPKNGSMAPLAPGVYGHLRVMNGSTLMLQPGAFRFCSINVGRGAALRTQGPGATTIDVVDSIKVGNDSFFGPDTNAPTPTVHALGSRVRIGALAVAEALLSAPNAKLTLGRSTRFAGPFCADRMNTDANAVIECTP